MASSVKINAKNFQQFSKSIETLSEDFVVAMQDGISDSGFFLEGQAKRITPVDTGRMRQSLNTSVAFLAATISPSVNYALFVHEGTVNQRSQPFFTITEQRNRTKVLKIVQKKLNALLNRITV